MDQKCLESFEMWCWRRMEKISWTDCVRNYEVLHGVIGYEEGDNERGIKVMGRKGGRCKQLLRGLKETSRYWKFKEVAVYRTLQTTGWTCPKTDCGLNEPNHASSPVAEPYKTLVAVSRLMKS